MNKRQNQMTRGEETRKAIYAFIKSYTGKYGYSPSVREIAKAAGLGSAASVQWHLQVLEERGMLCRRPGCPRALTLCTAGGERTEGI